MTPNAIGLIALVVLMIASFCTVTVVWEVGKHAWLRASAFGVIGTILWACGLFLVRVAELVAEVAR